MRAGASELYRAVEALPEVLDGLVVDLEYLGREALSARHVPNDVFQAQAAPRTMSGKTVELAVKLLLPGAAPDSVLNRDATANADCVDWFVDMARSRAAPQA